MLQSATIVLANNVADPLSRKPAVLAAMLLTAGSDLCSCQRQGLLADNDLPLGTIKR